MPDTPAESYRKRLQSLRQERTQWESHWREIADVILPRRIRFFSSDARNRGSKRNTKIIRGTATRALRIFTAGMMEGASSPSRPWFRLLAPDPDMNEFAPVRSWLGHIEERSREIFHRSNVYQALPAVYESEGAFGQAPMFVDEDRDDTIRAYVFPVGSYYLSNGPDLRVDTLYRESSMTVRQLVMRFGRDACSLTVRNAWDRGNYDFWIDICHVIEPNLEADSGYADNLRMAWRSAWLEVPKDSATKQLLSISGYPEFPVMAPRWTVTGEEVYGQSPAMDALGDILELQYYARKYSQAMEKIINPPMNAPASLRQARASIMPGEVNYLETGGPGNALTPAHEVDSRVLAAREEMESLKQAINEAFYVDLFLMLAADTRTNRTAREIEERHEEKMLQLGSALQRQNDELFGPLIDRTFAIMLRNGDVPEPPEELQGTTLGVEYISILAQTQKLIGTASVERQIAFVSGLGAVDPRAWDNIDEDRAIRIYADMLGVPPDIVRSAEAVAKIRQARQVREQLAEAAAAARPMLDAAKTAKTLSETRIQDGTALSNLASGPPIGAA